MLRDYGSTTDMLMAAWCATIRENSGMGHALRRIEALGLLLELVDNMNLNDTERQHATNTAYNHNAGGTTKWEQLAASANARAEGHPHEKKQRTKMTASEQYQ